MIFSWMLYWYACDEHELKNMISLVMELHGNWVMD